MARSLVMRQMDEKSTDQEVSLMVWSPKMDILALAFDTGCLSTIAHDIQKLWRHILGFVHVLFFRPRSGRKNFQCGF